MKLHLKIYIKALEKAVYTIAFILTVQLCFAQTIDFLNISPEVDFSNMSIEQEEELLYLYKNNRLSPEKLTKEQKKLLDAKIEKEAKEQELNDKELYQQQPKTEFITEDNKTINQYENKSNNEVEKYNLQEGKMLTLEEAKELEIIKEQDLKKMKLVEEEKPKN